MHVHLMNQQMSRSVKARGGLHRSSLIVYTMCTMDGHKRLNFMSLVRLNQNASRVMLLMPATYNHGRKDNWPKCPSTIEISHKDQYHIRQVCISSVVMNN